MIPLEVFSAARFGEAAGWDFFGWYYTSELYISSPNGLSVLVAKTEPCSCSIFILQVLIIIDK